MSTTLDIVRIPVLNDNYVWLMREPQSGAVGVGDPAVAGPMLAEAANPRWKITHILNTHHHGDHVGGNLEIKKATGCTIVGPRVDRARIPASMSRSMTATTTVSVRPRRRCSSCRVTPAATSPMPSASSG